MALLQKVRELCASLIASNSTNCYLCTFERHLQSDIAQIRGDFELNGGLRLDQFDQLMHKKNIRAICRRNGLSTLR